MELKIVFNENTVNWSGSFKTAHDLDDNIMTHRQLQSAIVRELMSCLQDAGVYQMSVITSGDSEEV